MQITSLNQENNTLVQYLDQLKSQKVETDKLIVQQNELKQKYERELASLQSKLQELDNSLQQNMMARRELDKTIAEAQRAYDTIVESTKKLSAHLREKLGGAQ